MVTTKELKNNIVLELLLANKIYIEEKIDYTKFALLYSNYNYLSEPYFAKIIGINYSSWMGLKAGKSYAIVLKNIDINLVDKILEDLIARKIVDYNEQITYQQFLDILSQVPFLGENTLANLLGIKTGRFQVWKHNRGGKTVNILPRHIISANDEQIINELLSQSIIYPGMHITYDEFKLIHNLYPDIEERHFARILEIENPFNMKKRNQKAIVLKSRISDFLNNQKNDIINFLIRVRNAKLNEKIDYKRFLELYSGFEYMTPSEFAEIILGIKYNTYRSMKSDGKNAIILKNGIELTDEMREIYFFSILDTFNLKEGERIDYKTFTNITELYKDSLTIGEIASILGIEDGMYNNMKYHNKCPRIMNGVTREKMYFINQYFKENRFYSKKEIYNILEQFSLTIHDFIIHIIKNRTFFDSKDYMEALEKNNGLYIGRCGIDQNFFSENYEYLAKHLKNVWYCIPSIDVKNDRDDMIQEVLIYIYETCGDLYKNFGNSEMFYKKIKSRANKRILGRVVNEISGRKIIAIPFSKLEKTKDLDQYIELKTKDVVEDEAIATVCKEDMYEDILAILENDGTLEDCLPILEKIDGGENKIYLTLKEKISKIS